MWNPYTQGGWVNGGYPNAGPSGSPVVPQPSIFGALPYPTQNSPPTFLAFRFTSFNTTILDSTVMGPKSQAYFRVTTDAPRAGFTVVQNSANQPMIMIEWSKNAIIEVRDIISKRHTSTLLALAPDKRCVIQCSPAGRERILNNPINIQLSDNDCKGKDFRLGTGRGVHFRA